MSYAGAYTKSSAPTARPMERPRTSVHAVQGRGSAEWRSIHVKSLSRVDTILREAVGLGAAGSSRWTVYAPGSELRHGAASSGLGISMAQKDGRGLGADVRVRPGTAHGQMSTQKLSGPANGGRFSVSHPLYTATDSLNPFPTAIDKHKRAGLSDGLARPSTSSARLGQALPPLPSPPSLPRHHSESVPGQEHGDGRPAQLHASPPDEWAGGNSSRIMSMYIPSNQAPPSYSSRRHMSVYGAFTRPIHLSRDESRRSRLFAEYEQLVARKEGDDDGNETPDSAYQDEDEQRSSVDSDSYQEARSIAVSRQRSGGLGDIDEETEGDFSSYEDVLTSSSILPPGSPDRARTTIQASPKRPVTMQQRTSEALGDARDTKAKSMFGQADLFSRQQTERRWSRIIYQNQHLFTTHDSEEPVRGGQLAEDPLSKPGGGAGGGQQGRSGAAQAQSLVLDLPASADLFHDVTQALAEHLPPVSAGSTASGSSAATVAGRQDNNEAEKVAGETVDGARGGAKRESIYIDPESLFGSGLFADEDFMYQYEGTGPADTQESEYTPTIAAGSLLDDQGAGPGKLSVKTTVEVARPRGAEGPADGEDPAESADEEGPGEAASHEERHSVYIRKQLQDVEEHTTASALGTELSRGDAAHAEMLGAYMMRFDFHEQPVDFALRELFRQFQLPAESQQIDRVISSFAERYHACNPDLFVSAEVVYAYAFAILLLHTDAHNPKVRQKMTKAQFTAHAKLLDEHGADDDGNDMSDEVLDILYENVTMVKFEYAPSGGAEGLAMAPAVRARPEMRGVASAPGSGYSSPALSDGGAREQSPGISGWLRRMFTSVSAPGVTAKAPPSPQDIPSKEQYSYTGWRRVESVSGSGASPAETLAFARRPSTAHGTFSRSSSSGGNVNSLAAISGSGSATLPRIRASTSGPPMASALGASASSMPGPSLMRPFKSSPLANGNMGALAAAASPVTSEAASPRGSGSPGSPRAAAMGSSFTASDVGMAAAPAVESIRLKGVKSHVRRRVSLRQGRPLSGIIYQDGAAAPTAPADAGGNALLRVEMAGHVTRKMERLDNGRRGLVRRWKGFWMVLSGSRLYFFRRHDAAMAVQTIVSLRSGVAVVDAAYTKYAHVFRILADDGSEMLVKADDDDAVAEWMARINCAAAFKTMDIDRRSPDTAESSADRACQLERCLKDLDARLEQIDDQLELRLRRFRQLASMVPLTRQGRTRSVQYADAARARLKELYLSEQRLTCYKDVLSLDLAIEYEICSQEEDHH
ncbi:hypothetical protein GGF46_002473 [Coemansia sp. RSA 552]|nr:hypothetical protein GGF46_002473 [Coemansia sp. RSA 552]